MSHVVEGAGSPFGTPLGAPLGTLGDAGFTLSEPAQYLRDRWAAFEALGPRIIDLQHKAAVAAGAARAVGLWEDYELAREIIRDLGELNQAHNAALLRMEQLGTWLGLGAIQVPLALATAFASLALVVAWVFRRYDYQEGLVEKLEAGTITTEDLRALAADPSPGGIVGDVVGGAKALLWVGLAVGALFLWRELRGAGELFAANPRLVTYEANPPEEEPIGERVYVVAYRHAENGEPYYHDFGPGVTMAGAADGSVVLRHPMRRLWKDF